MKSGMRNLPELSLINLCRALSIFLVLAQHVNNRNAVCAVPQDHLIRLFYGRFTSNGIYGVTMFFVLSGYLITRLIAEMPGGLYRPDFKDFYIRRIGRIIPLLLLISLIGILISTIGNPNGLDMDTCFKNRDTHYSFGFWLSIYTFSFNWFHILNWRDSPTLALNWVVLWSLSIEEQFYLIYPAVLARIKTERRLIGLLGLIIVGGPLYRQIAYWISPNNLSLAIYGSFGCFDQIAIGALLYLLSQKYKTLLSRNLGLCIQFCVCGVLVIGFTFFSTNAIWNGAHGIQMIFGPTLISLGLFLFLLGGLHLGVFEKNRLLKGFSSIGRYSYGMYLLHATVLYFLWPVIVGMDVFAAFGLFFSLTAVLAYFSNRYFEVPINHWLRKKMAPG
jgi:peptidoglycan/LPS O-acetylase OafA/YrhL